MPDPCPQCGADRVLVGYAHNCRPRPQKVERASTGAARQKRYRQKNPEKHRAYMRDYMRRKRHGAAADQIAVV